MWRLAEWKPADHHQTGSVVMGVSIERSLPGLLRPLVIQTLLCCVVVAGGGDDVIEDEGEKKGEKDMRLWMTVTSVAQFRAQIWFSSCHKLVCLDHVTHRAASTFNCCTTSWTGWFLYPQSHRELMSSRWQHVSQYDSDRDLATRYLKYGLFLFILFYE